ncbi:MAG: extracellular solute-binding protein [Anaerolineae bacterium]
MKLRRTSRVAFGFLALVAIGWLLAACDGLSAWPPFSSSVSTPTTEPETLSTPTATPPSEATATPAPRVITLDFWVPAFLSPYQETPGGDVFDEQLSGFSSFAPDVQVRVTVKKDQGAGGLYDLLSAASEVAPSVMPDLLILNQHDLIKAAEAGLIQPLDDVFFSEADYFPTALDSVRTLDGLWGLPFVARADQMAYREGIAATAPLSWTAVLTSSYSMLFPALPGEDLASDTLLSIYIGAGGQVQDQNGQATLERNSLENVYTFFLEMTEGGLLNAEQALSLADATACWNLYQEGIGQLTPVPTGTFWPNPPEGTSPAWAPTANGMPVTVLHTWGLAVVTEEPAYREAAVELALWLSSANRMAELTDAAEMVPTRREAIENWALAPEDVAFLSRLLSSSVPALPPSVDTTVRRSLQSGLIALLEREVETAEGAASQALTNLRR